jgi:hypothetical protein
LSVRSDVLLWANRIVNKGTGAAPNHYLEIKETASIEDAQNAFHKIAKIAHPDLHRAELTPEELELITTAYGRVANAYQEFRTQRMQSSRFKAVGVTTPPGMTPPQRTRPPSVAPAPSTTPPLAAGSSPAQEIPKTTPQGPAAAMTSKALVYYRKAELSLKRGDLKGAVLQLKMAIAADPLSTLLRQALTEVESEISKGG